jgi:uncharacterized membrane protein YhhN
METIRALVSVGASLAYGLVLVGRPPSIVRAVVKTAAVAALALLACVSGQPVLLVAALAFSALGDAFMSDPERFLPPGLGSFLLAHLLYIPLFWSHGDTALAMEPARMAALIATVAIALVLLAWLWPTLGKMRPAVIAYVGAIGGMVTTSFLLPAALWPAMAGAALFMASDAVLAGELFRKARLFGSQRATDFGVWFLYWGGQAAITYAFVS